MSRRAGLPTGAAALVGLFVTALVTAQVTGSKLLTFDLPFVLPVTGTSLVVPGGVFAYALTFFASDCYAELYGKRPAQVVVNVGFALNFVLLGLLWLTILSPAAESGVPPETFRSALAPATNIVAGSLLAYLVSQNLDVLLFHGIRELTGGGFLWFRNIVSTATSQAVDTAIFIGIAFYLLPRYAGIGPTVPTDVVLALLVGQYFVKLLIAVADTPFVYVVTAVVRAREPGHADLLFADSG